MNYLFEVVSAYGTLGLSMGVTNNLQNLSPVGWVLTHHLKIEKIMSNYSRTFLPEGTFFLTLVTYKKRSFLTTDLSRKILKQSWQDVQRKMPFSLEAVCLLPDHIHLLITLPENDSNYSERIKMLKSLFTINFIKAGGFSKQIPCEKRGSGYMANTIWGAYDKR